MSPLPISLDHLERLTDDTGMLEHACGLIPNRKEGYCADDNARALWAATAWLQHVPPGSADARRLLRLIDRYLAFLLWVQQDDGHFYNNVAYDRRWEPETPSDDCFGRCLWACAVAVSGLDADRRSVAAHMIQRALPYISKLRFLRGQAYALAACSFLLAQIEGRNVTCRGLVDTSVLKESVTRLERALTDAFETHRERDWSWFEPELTYANGILPWAMYWAYTATGNPRTLDIARESFHFLVNQMTGPDGTVRPIGNQGWSTRTTRADWDQQPLDVMKLALAAAKAWEVDRDEVARDVVVRCRAWFHGANDLGLAVANVCEGSSCDGLKENGLNRNQGAESTLSYLLTEYIHHSVEVGIHERSHTTARNHSFACV
jgi:hypothetical protein